MLTLADQPLAMSETLFTETERLLSRRLATPWTPRRAPTSAMLAAGIPDFRRVPAVEWGSLHTWVWPAWGLSRWAHGHFLAHAETATAITTEAFGLEGTEWNPVLLRIWAKGTAGNSQLVEFPVYLLPPTCIARANPVEYQTTRGLYLLTVVDRRFFLGYQSTPTLDFKEGVPEPEGGACDPDDPIYDPDAPEYDPDAPECDPDLLPGPLTWPGLYHLCAEAAGIELTWDPVNPAYLRPHPSIVPSRTQGRATIAELLDVAAASVGQRIVARFDGTFHAQNWWDALQVRDTNHVEFPERTRVAGGLWYQHVL